ALTAQGYFNNIIRACLQSLAAVLGGTQSLHCSSFDEALGLPTEESALVALRTQQIIRYETGIVNVTDPLGGSYYVEWLTQRLVDETFKLMADIQNIGIKEAIARGYVKSLIEESAYETQKRIENEEQIIVGVNKFQDPTVLKNVFRTDPTEERLIIQRLKEFKKNRDLSKVKCALRDLERAKHSEENLMTYIIRCVESNCTLGEISKALS
ncbi:MAG: methylmalonyl-CoA mutase family protein, partial [Deltaproteobacteria bacterium]|nr:methylmalonyl-CoA mutase family protein [Deltaproteobacteria bacterium]